MARFRFSLVGTSQTPVVDVPQSNLSELSDAMGRQRFLEGVIVGIDGLDGECGVLIPVNRIQLISEVEL